MFGHGKDDDAQSVITFDLNEAKQEAVDLDDQEREAEETRLNTELKKVWGKLLVVLEARANHINQSDGKQALIGQVTALVEQLQAGSQGSSLALPAGGGNAAPRQNTSIEVSQLQGEIRQLETDKRDLLAEVRDHAAQEATIETVRRDAAKADHRIAELEGQLQAKTDEVKRLEKGATNATDSQELTNAAATIRDLESRISSGEASHTTALRAKEDEIASLRTQVGALQAENTDVQRTVTDLLSWSDYFIGLEERSIANPDERKFTIAHAKANSKPAPAGSSSSQTGTQPASTQTPNPASPQGTTDTATTTVAPKKSRRSPVQWAADKLPGHKPAGDDQSQEEGSK